MPFAPDYDRETSGPEARGEEPRADAPRRGGRSERLRAQARGLDYGGGRRALAVLPEREGASDHAGERDGTPATDSIVLGLVNRLLTYTLEYWDSVEDEVRNGLDRVERHLGGHAPAVPEKWGGLLAGAVLSAVVVACSNVAQLAPVRAIRMGALLAEVQGAAAAKQRAGGDLADGQTIKTALDRASDELTIANLASLDNMSDWTEAYTDDVTAVRGRREAEALVAAIGASLDKSRVKTGAEVAAELAAEFVNSSRAASLAPVHKGHIEWEVRFRQGERPRILRPRVVGPRPHGVASLLRSVQGQVDVNRMFRRVIHLSVVGTQRGFIEIEPGGTSFILHEDALTFFEGRSVPQGVTDIPMTELLAAYPAGSE